jgi:hypothetical protein
MAEVPVQRHFVTETAVWIVRHAQRESGLLFVNEASEVRLLRLDGTELPTEDQLACASEMQLKHWLSRTHPLPRSRATKSP